MFLLTSHCLLNVHIYLMSGLHGEKTITCISFSDCQKYTEYARSFKATEECAQCNYRYFAACHYMAGIFLSFASKIFKCRNKKRKSALIGWTCNLVTVHHRDWSSSAIGKSWVGCTVALICSVIGGWGTRGII
ncbi:hypothetical protein KIL84_017301 [Mauremys mutica]|uniref:Uncharacterized protein n=1 Tax=Mauremys mutica TaxID=74926 RepID=A0A9D3X608_9SAUR|nr:hypothetical protein KIL84_017301 [Mauremys mutica]